MTLEETAETLYRMGRRRTPGRRRLLRALFEAGRPVSARQLHQLVHKEVDMVTIYRFLHDLVELGLASRIDIRIGASAYFASAYFPRYTSQEGHEHYLICKMCAKTVPFMGCIVEQFLEMNPNPSGFRVESHSLTLFGVCAACQEPARRELPDDAPRYNE